VRRSQATSGARCSRRFNARWQKRRRAIRDVLIARTLKRPEGRARALGTERAPEGGSPSLAELPANG
jgi:hypothetical protein